MSKRSPKAVRGHSIDSSLATRMDEDGFGAADRSLHEIFSRIFDAIHALSPGDDVLIGHCSSLSHELHVEHASGAFAHLERQSLQTSSGIFRKLLNSKAEHITADDTLLKRTDSAFANFETGECAAYKVKLDGDVTAILLYWHPSRKGRLDPRRIEALRLIVELAGQAACASDLSLDVEAQGLQLNSLNAEMEKTHAFYRQLSDAVRQCFWVIDIDAGSVAMVSDNFERVWGASRRVLEDGLTGFMATVLPEDRDRVLSEFHTQLGREFETELRVIGEDGEVRWIWLRSFPILGDGLRDETPLSSLGHRSVFIVADEISDKKTLEEAVRTREADLVSRDRILAVGDLASGVAHEINNPLTVIVGKSDEALRMLKRPAFDLAAVTAAIDKVLKNSIRIAEIVNSLKSLSRKDKLVQYRFCPFNKIIHDVTDLISEKFRIQGVELQIQPMPADFGAEINNTMISQLLLNLLNNACDAVQDEKEKWIKIEFAEDDASVFLYVTDSGPGIPIKNRGRIFDPFFTTKEPGKGTGLGLSLAAAFAAHHGGMLRLDHFHANTRFVAQLPKYHDRQQKKAA